MKNDYIKYSNLLGYGDLTKMKAGSAERKRAITLCADGYIDATANDDDSKRSAYISALMLLFWGEIGKMQEKCRGVSDMDFEDFAAKLYECIEVACKYHAWKDGKTTAEACIRQTISSRGVAAILYKSNLDRSKVNANLYSLDTVIGSEDGKEITIGDLVEDESENFAANLDSTSWMIQKYINENKIMEAVFLDNMAYSDCMRMVKTVTKVTDSDGVEHDQITSSSELWVFKLIQTISNLELDYFTNFKSRYDVNESILKAVQNRLHELSTTKLRKALQKTLESARKDFAFLVN